MNLPNRDILIKQIEGLADEKLILHIQENPYMQHFCGIKEFSCSLLFAPETASNDGDDDKPEPPNNGTLIMDATCAPANITFPQDIKLCNEAREKTESMVETMHQRGVNEKPRLDKQKARREYLKVAKSKKRAANVLRKAIKKQLSCIRRNLKYIDSLNENYDELSSKQKVELETIHKLYEQQKQMIDNRTHTVENRIVSISQPHVRPTVIMSTT